MSGPSGSKVVIPAGALTTNAAIKIEQTSVGAPPLPPNLVAIGDMYAFTPHGTVFSAPVTITLPFDPSRVVPGMVPTLYKTNAQNQWEKVTTATFDATTVTAQLTNFSFAAALLEPITAGEPRRVWRFAGIHANGFPQVIGMFRSQVGGTVSEHVNFGGALFDHDVVTLTGNIPADRHATGYVFGTADGATYGAYSEAPNGNPFVSDAIIGSLVEFEQSQTFIKNTADATLSFTVTDAIASAADSNQFTTLTRDTRITAELDFSVEARESSRPAFYSASGGARVKGSFNQWDIDIFSRLGEALWDRDDFEIEVGLDSDLLSTASLELRRPITFEVDLSGIHVGDSFTLTSVVVLETINRRGGGPGFELFSAVNAYFRDPLEIGGTTIAFAGLTMIDPPLTTPPPDGPAEPAACVPGPGPIPASGLIQFNAPAFSAGEFAGETSVVEIVRTGGTSGAVTATFRTSDGTALAGTDYTPVNVTVSFGDGDDTPRFVDVPIVFDAAIETDKTVNLTLSQPGGCGALGPQATAVLTIQDDDSPPTAVPLP
ncbi:MAG: hypothetical protein H7Y89_07940, partial [Steroidobacteraceae bacterium]|nr:hypothetical protein [Steroidobacteraceae bacterium]